MIISKIIKISEYSAIREENIRLQPVISGLNSKEKEFKKKINFFRQLGLSSLPAKTL